MCSCECVSVCVHVCVCGKYEHIKEVLGYYYLNDTNVWYVSSPPNTFENRNVYILQCIMFHTV